MHAVTIATVITIGGILHLFNRRRGRRNLRQPEEVEVAENSGQEHNRADRSTPVKVEANRDGASGVDASPTIAAAVSQPSSVLPLAEDLFSGWQLARYFAAGQSRSIGVCRFIAANLLLQLEALHCRGVMHRDINMEPCIE
ncbi:hypothetical protein BSKO_13205 [Bryopsis sp. KO-2023]|nr:hypothetical protein BSKO_13205 [Bryopsis sp. KO-2023]